MMFPARILRGIADGTIDRAFRRWEQPRVKPGGRQRTAIGVVGFSSVDAIDRETLTTEDAERAGYPSREALLAFVDRRSSGSIYRVGLELVGPDPRVVLRDELPDEEEHRQIEAKLKRLDRASRHGPWTRTVLRTIGDRPGIPAAELAASLGREKMPFKLDVRKLKELGLTESLRPGYRLSPRGDAVIARISARLSAPNHAET